MKNTYRIRIISVLFLLSIFFPAQYIYATDVIYENQQNNTTVSGTIKDVNDTPVIGASVVIDGTNTGVISDIDGKFIINVTNPSTATLKISFIGFKTQMIKVGNQKELKITRRYECLRGCCHCRIWHTKENKSDRFNWDN